MIAFFFFFFDDKTYEISLLAEELKQIEKKLPSKEEIKKLVINAALGNE